MLIRTQCDDFLPALESFATEYRFSLATKFMGSMKKKHVPLPPQNRYLHGWIPKNIDQIIDGIEPEIPQPKHLIITKDGQERETYSFNGQSYKMIVKNWVDALTLINIETRQEICRIRPYQVGFAEFAGPPRWQVRIGPSLDLKEIELPSCALAIEFVLMYLI